MNPWGAAIIIVAFGLVLVACFSDVGRPVAVRIIGGAVSFTYFCFLVVSLSPGYSRRLGVDVEGESWKMLVGAVMGFLLWGLPGLYVMITGKFPWWWRKPARNDTEHKKN